MGGVPRANLELKGSVGRLDTQTIPVSLFAQGYWDFQGRTVDDGSGDLCPGVDGSKCNICAVFEGE